MDLLPWSAIPLTLEKKGVTGVEEALEERAVLMNALLGVPCAEPALWEKTAFPDTVNRLLQSHLLPVVWIPLIKTLVHNADHQDMHHNEDPLRNSG